MKPLSVRILKELGEALKMFGSFGSYTFDDKGADEVMGIPELVEALRKLSANKAAEVLLEVSGSKKHKGRGAYAAFTIACACQDWDELFAIRGIEDILDGPR